MSGSTREDFEKCGNKQTIHSVEEFYTVTDPFHVTILTDWTRHSSLMYNTLPFYA